MIQEYDPHKHLMLMWARNASASAQCRRRRIGAVIVKQNRIVGTGYNGSPRGQLSCLAGACPRGKLSEEELAPYSSYDSGPGKCVAVHAEVRAILDTPRNLLAGSIMYVTDEPCWGCSLLIQEVGIVKVVCGDGNETRERPGTAPRQDGR